MNYLEYVNVKQGTRSVYRFSNGNTLPLTQRPFGFASFSPQTNGMRGAWFYHPDDRSLEGIRLTHQPSPWIGDHASLTLLPQIDTPRTSVWHRWSSFEPAEAELHPHYLKCRFKRAFADFSLTPTEYGARILLEFERDFDRFFSVVPINDEEGGFCEYRFDSEKNILFCCTDCNTYKGTDSGALKGYYAFKFDSASVDTEKIVIEDLKNDLRKTGLEICGENTGIHLYLKKKRVEFSVATSFISYEQALLNLEHDSDFKDFEDLKKKNAEIWNKQLSKIEIETDNKEQLKTFYSCMYRLFLFPHKAHEIDANGTPVHYAPCSDSVKTGYRYTDVGFWDTYRTAMPLQSLILGDKYKEILEGFIQDYRDGGRLPRWTSGDAKVCMPSTFIDVAIADSAVKGIIGGELLETAFEGMEKNANTPSENPAYGRTGIADYIEKGYIPCDKHTQSVNLTLDAAYCDYCLAVVADILGYEDKKQKYLERAKNYKNIFDSETGFMRGRDTGGNMAEAFDPITWSVDYTEASAWSTSLAVQHDFEGLYTLMGGKDKLLSMLDRLFAAPAEYRVPLYEPHEVCEMSSVNFGQCAISNQPSFHIPFMYSYLGEKAKSDYWISKICNELFSSEDDGFPGDEDNGTMSAWYIFATLGFYPLCPGKPEYTVTAPLCKNAKILGKSIDLSAFENILPHTELIKQIAE